MKGNVCRQCFLANLWLSNPRKHPVSSWQLGLTVLRWRDLGIKSLDNKAEIRQKRCKARRLKTLKMVTHDNALFQTADTVSEARSVLTPSLPPRTSKGPCPETWHAPSAACEGLSQKPSAELPTESRRLRATSCMQPLVLHNSNTNNYLVA